MIPGLSESIKRANLSEYSILFDKQVYIIDLCDDPYNVSLAINKHIIEKLGLYYIGNKHIIEKQNKTIKEIDDECYFDTIFEFDEILKKSNEKTSDNNFFKLDNNEKKIIFLNNQFDNKDKFTNEPYFFVIKAYLAAQMACLEGYEIDYSELTKTKNKTLDIFKSYCNKLNSINFNNEQILFYGAPGSGKSYKVKEKIMSKMNLKSVENVEKLENVFRITLYPDYSYSDFVGNIMPVVKKIEDETLIEYDFKSGIFIESLKYAYLNPGETVFLVIEEINRGNISNIFGDIFQLLDRNKFGYSEYSINNEMILEELKKDLVLLQKVILPVNLYIFGTANMSDQNVYVMDTAFKRRFNFIYSDVEPSSNLNEYTFELYGVDKAGNIDYSDVKKFEWNKLYMTLNEFILVELELGEDKQIGQFFIKFENIKGRTPIETEQLKYNEISNKLLHYLWEDVCTLSYGETRIFDSRYNTFGKLYKAFQKKKNIFSEAFLKKYPITW